MYQYLSVTSGLESFVRKSFFRDIRGEDNILLRNHANSITRDAFDLLTGNTNRILDFYNQNKKFLNLEKQRDTFINDNYQVFQEKFQEYFLALENYDSYVYAYSEGKRQLLEVDTISDITDTTLSQEKFLSYISQFKFLSLDSLQLEIVDDTYYKAAGIFIQ